MSWQPLADQVTATMHACRDSLDRLETRYGNAEDAGADDAALAGLQAFVVCYSEMIAALREFLGSLEMGRPSPARLADRLGGFVDRLRELDPGPQALAPTAQDVQTLVAMARSLASA